MCFVNKRLLKKKRKKKWRAASEFHDHLAKPRQRAISFFSSSVERNAKMTTHLTDPCLLRSRSTLARACASLTVPNLKGFVTSSFATKAPTSRKESVERSGGEEGGTPDFKWRGWSKEFLGGWDFWFWDFLRKPIWHGLLKLASSFLGGLI